MMPERRPGTPTVVDGIRYRSKFEAAVAQDLLNRGVEFGYEAERLAYEVPRIYVVDFTILRPRHLRIEVKGYFPPEDRRRLVELKRKHPDLDLRLVFQRAKTRISKARGASTYAQWAERNGFPWAEGRVPEEWIEEVNDG